MDTSIPINFTELFKLPSLGIKPESISFSNVSLESDKYICVREKTQTANTLTVIEVATQQTETHKINAERAAMNPKTKVVALGAGQNLQIYNLEMKSLVKEYTFPEPIVFWKWISVKTIALITQTAVYHWSMQGSDNPKKVFERHQSLQGATIINYRTDSEEKWLLLIGLTRGQNNQMKGVMQLYSVDRGVTQPIEGHAAAFIDFKMRGGKTATLVAIAGNLERAGGKLFIMEVPGNNRVGFEQKAVDINFAPGDFPVAMQASEKLGVLYIITLKGLLYVYDVETGGLIFSTRISSDQTGAIFVTAPHEEKNGVLGINNKAGQVLSISVDEQKVVPYLIKAGNVPLALRLASRANLPGAEDIYITQFNNFLNEGKIEEAVRLAIASPKGLLRTPQTIQRLQRIPRTDPSQKPALALYFQYVQELDKLNEYESIELAKIVLQRPGGIEYIKQLIQQDKIEVNEKLGDLVKPLDAELAMQIYLKGKAHEKNY